MTCLIVGDANADLAASVEFFPREGDDAAIRALGFQSGGTAANVAVALARLGAPARLLARTGHDPAAAVALRAAREANVDLALIQHDPELTTGLCFAVISPSGERTFFSHRGANVALALPDVEAAFRDVSWLHLSGHALLAGTQRQTALALIAEAHKRRTRVSLDLCLPYLRAHAAEMTTLAPQLSALFANAHELILLGTALGLSGNDADVLEAALSLLGHAGAPLVVAKLGAAGSRIVQGAFRADVPPLPVRAVDTTGAGDGFVAAFLFSLLRGGSPEMAARVGNVVGALVASRPGAAEAAPFAAEVRAILDREYPHLEIEALFSRRSS